MTVPMPIPCRCPIRRRAGMCDRLPSMSPQPSLTKTPTARRLTEEGA
ncbi:hypothetical protein C8E08_4029 [Paracidovorax citrulli]|nr:hypothetical protein C8E08_4029 [Paracidovorax citrulli]REG69217.1 hypothetical protein C8E07_2359 [Paracidovorax citrulli]RLJ93772.1 hypothetical protein C8E06_2359 [Paracidovorax citrulli]